MDPRTPAQRRFDQFFAILEQYEDHCQESNDGAASMVLALTLDDLADDDAAMLFDTNTGIENLTGLFREHHRCNNEHGDGSFNKEFMDFDPQTGRSGFRRRPGDPLRFKQSVPAPTFSGKPDLCH